MKVKLFSLIAVVMAACLQIMAADPGPATEGLTAAQAKELALKAHAEAAAMDQLPRFFYRAKSGNGDIDTMREREGCTIEGLKEALDGPVAEKDWLQWTVTLAWSENHALYSTGENEGPRYSEEGKLSRHDSVWTRDLAFDRSSTALRPARFVYTGTANQLWEGRLREFAFFRVSPHRFWWAESTNHMDSISLVPPEEAEYRFVCTEKFDDEICDVVEAPSRAERLWIGRNSKHLHGVLVSMYRGGPGDEKKEPFHLNERVKKITGRTFANQSEYGQWYFNDSSSQQKKEVARLWNELNFDSFGPNELIRFRDYREVAPDVWIPFREDRAFTHGVDRKPTKHKYIRLWVAVEEVQTDVDLAETIEPMQPQEGEQIQDQRFGVVIDYKFEPNRTQSELLELVDTERHKQAANADLMKRMIAPIEALVGKPAPELPKDGWVGGTGPNDMNHPYLLHFWANWCGPCKNDFPLLKQLAAEGLPVFGMHPSGITDDEVGQIIDDRTLGYPTCIASSKTEGENRQMGGYPVALFPYFILVDRTGCIAAHGRLEPEMIAKLRELLEKD